MEKLKLELSRETLETIKKYLIESYVYNKYFCNRKCKERAQSLIGDENLRKAIYEFTKSMPTNYNLKNN